jgi:alpha-tubulin suppressor-like RCC1 family protein
MRRLSQWGLTVGTILVASAIIGAAPAVASNGVASWGANEEGQLGDGTLTEKNSPQTIPAPSGVTQLAAGDEYSLALLESGNVMAWGTNFLGELGDGIEAGPESCRGFPCSRTPVEVSGLSEVVTVAASRFDFGKSLAVLKNGKTMRWGDFIEVPEEVPGLSEVTAVAVGNESYYALRLDGTVMAWGENSCGQLGDGTTTEKSSPTEVGELGEVAAIGAGYDQAFAVLKNGTVKSWGCNEVGQLGDGSTEKSSIPVEVHELNNVTAVAGGDGFSLALLATGEVVSWGKGEDGELGAGEEVEESEVPVKVSGLTEVTSIAAGEEYSLAVLKDGTIMAWGENDDGAFGNGEEDEESFVPVLIGGITQGAIGVAASENHSLAFGPPGPIVANVTPGAGPPAGGTKVEITGQSFTGVTSVKFGSTNASSYEVVSPTLIKATTPAGTGTTHVKVTTSTGMIESSQGGSGSAFRYVPVGAPEFGRCVGVTAETGKFSSAKCTKEKAKGSFEWLAGVVKTHFTLSGGEGKLVTLAGKKVICTGETGGGEYNGTKDTRAVQFQLTGCVLEGNKCTTTGATEGEIKTTTLTGALGWKSAETSSPALDLAAAEGEPIAEFQCGSKTAVVRGSVIVALNANEMALAPTLKYSAPGGKQNIENLEGEPTDVLETSLNGAAFEQTGLTVTTTQTNEEEVEVNATV